MQDVFIVDAAAVRSDRTDADIKGSKPAPPLNLDTFAFREELITSVTYDVGTGKTTPVTDNSRTIRTAYYHAAKGSNEQNKILSRNRLQDIIINRSVDICNYHKGAILANKSVFDFSTGLLATILGTASGAVGGETAARILGTASGAVSATGLALDANFYQNLFATAIIREIDTSRKEFFDNKIVPRRTGSTTDYTVDQAIRDANEYHTKCSFFQGVVALVKETKDDPMTRDEILGEIARLTKEMETLESKFAPGVRDDRVKQDAEFLWNIYSTRKKQPCLSG